VPLVKPATEMGLDAPLPVNPPGLEVTVNPVIADPPLPFAVKATDAVALPGVAVPMVGATGTVAGVTAFDAAEAALVPTELVAVTLKVYEVPFVRPDTTIGLEVPVPVIPPGVEVTVYPVMTAPPLPFGVNVTLALALPLVAVPMVGACGTVGGTPDSRAISPPNPSRLMKPAPLSSRKNLVVTDH